MATAKKSAAKKATTGGAKPAAKRMGRPPKPEGEKKSATLLLRMTSDQKVALQNAAERLAVDLSTFIVDAALEKGSKISRK